MNLRTVMKRPFGLQLADFMISCLLFLIKKSIYMGMEPFVCDKNTKDALHTHFRSHSLLDHKFDTKPTSTLMNQSNQNIVIGRKFVYLLPDIPLLFSF